MIISDFIRFHYPIPSVQLIQFKYPCTLSNLVSPAQGVVAVQQSCGVYSRGLWTRVEVLAELLLACKSSSWYCCCWRGGSDRGEVGLQGLASAAGGFIQVCYQPS